MTKIDFDPELVAALCLEICDRYKLIQNLFPKNMEDGSLLKHHAASYIHLTLFVNDICCHMTDKKIVDENGIVKKFLEKCGCDLYKKDLIK